MSKAWQTERKGVVTSRVGQPTSGPRWKLWGLTSPLCRRPARASRRSTVSDNFVRFCSGCDPKVELWFSRTGTAGRSGFRPEDLTVVYWDCRTLCVAVKTGCCHFLVVNVHAPTAQDDRREQWWRDLRGCLSRVSSGQAVVLMGDFNVRFNMPVLGRIGEHVWDSKHAVPAALPRLLEEHDVWFPSTYADVHRGQHETWVAPGGQAGARIDYVAVPCSWVVQAGGSCVVVELDSGHRAIDHFAVQLDVWVPVQQRTASAARGCKVDRRAMCSEEGQAKIRHICSQIPLQDWHLDADTHYFRVQQFLQGALLQAFPATKPQRAKSYLTDATWVIKDHRVWLRKQTAQLRQQCRAFGLWAAFRAWRYGHAAWEACCATAVVLCGKIKRHEGNVDQLRSSRNELRRSIRHDRRQWLQDLAQGSASMSVKDVVTRLDPCCG